MIASSRWRGLRLEWKRSCAPSFCAASPISGLRRSTLKGPLHSAALAGEEVFDQRLLFGCELVVGERLETIASEIQIAG